MTNEPKVTGLSPMTGPPGTKITVRGENLGQSSDDIIRLTVNGADCLPYLEWKSPKKIITRCTRTLGKGDIIITTNSGGLGTCDVQFNCYEAIVRPTDESAVWVDDIDYQVPEKEKLTIPGSSEEYSIDFSSSQFKPQIYLIHNHSNASLEELEQLRIRLQNENNDPQLTKSDLNRKELLKSNLPTIMECLQILERLSKELTTLRDDHPSIEVIMDSIEENLAKTHELFDPLLAKTDLVQSIESAMQIFRQNETLFNLPSAIESSIESKNYDSVVKEISGVLSRLKTINIEQSLLEKIEQDVTTKVDKLKNTIEQQLQQICQSTNGKRNIDEVKKLICHLNRLGDPVNYDVWRALKEISKSLIEILSERHDHFLRQDLDEAKVALSERSSAVKSSSQDKPPYVQFVEIAMSIFDSTYYDILSLGQSYFDPKDEFACKESEETKQANLIEFEDMIRRPIRHHCALLRACLVPDSPKLKERSPWISNDNETRQDWLRHLLQLVITCHIHLTKANLPPVAQAALEDFKDFVCELRVRSMGILFKNATDYNKKQLHREEDWVIEVDDMYGGRTKLPSLFERNVIEMLRFANETIFKTSLPEENSILKRYDVQAKMKEYAQELIFSFKDSLDRALTDNTQHLAETTHILLASRGSSREPPKYTNRQLITICNCQFTKDQIFSRLQDEFEKLHGLDTKMDRVFEKCRNKYCDYIRKISGRFCEDLSKRLRDVKRNNIKALQLDLMVVNSQIFLIAPQLVNSLMTSIVNSMHKEQSVSRF